MPYPLSDASKNTCNYVDSTSCLSFIRLFGILSTTVSRKLHSAPPSWRHPAGSSVGPNSGHIYIISEEVDLQGDIAEQ